MIRRELVYKREISSTTRRFRPSRPWTSTRSLMSYGCFTNKKMQAPKNSDAVDENMNEREINVDDAVDRMEWNPVSKNETIMTLV